jgi:plasmid stabilization system protein ParE
LKVTYTEEAIADIVEAIAYLNERNPTAAANLDADLARCIERLASHDFEGPMSRLRSHKAWSPSPSATCRMISFKLSANISEEQVAGLRQNQQPGQTTESVGLHPDAHVRTIVLCRIQDSGLAWVCAQENIDVEVCDQA